MVALIIAGPRSVAIGESLVKFQLRTIGRLRFYVYTPLRERIMTGWRLLQFRERRLTSEGTADESASFCGEGINSPLKNKGCEEGPIVLYVAVSLWAKHSISPRLRVCFAMIT